MTIYVDVWCAVYCTTQDFKALSEIGQLQKGLRSKSCHLGAFCSPSPGPVYRQFDEGSRD